MEILMQWLVFLFVLGILVLAHEFGHFLVARKNGIRVERFAFGFGPVLIRYRLKETDLLVCAVPLGGYVKMAGDARNDSKGENDEFFAKSVGARAQVVFAGPLFNFVLSLVIFWAIFISGTEQPQPVVGQNLYPVDNQLYTAQELRLLKENNILGKNLTSFINENERVFYFYTGKESALQLQQKLADLGLDRAEEISGLLLATQTPSFRAGVRPKDRIISVNGEEVDSWEKAASLIRDSKENIKLEIDRQGSVLDLEVIPEQVKIPELKWFMRIEEKEISRIGIFPSYEKEKYSFFRAGGMALRKIWLITAMLFKGLFFTIMGAVPFKESFAGPIGIFKITGAVAKMGLNYLFDLIGVLSVSLGVINLFPIPVLDGGHLFFMSLEKVRGKPVPAKWEDVLTWIGLGLLLLFLLFVSYNDLVR